MRVRTKTRKSTKTHLATLGAAAALVAAAPAQSPITYVDITDGPTGNTLQFTNGGWGLWEAVPQTSTPNDGLWDECAFGNFATIYQNVGVAAKVDTAAPRLRTTLTVPEAPPGMFYNVYVLFWIDTSFGWRVALRCRTTRVSCRFTRPIRPG